jgi:hypothetical protein
MISSKNVTVDVWVNQQQSQISGSNQSQTKKLCVSFAAAIDIKS